MAKLEKHMIRLEPGQFEAIQAMFPTISVSQAIRSMIKGYLKRAQSALEKEEIILEEDIDV